MIRMSRTLFYRVRHLGLCVHSHQVLRGPRDLLHPSKSELPLEPTGPVERLARLWGLRISGWIS